MERDDEYPDVERGVVQLLDRLPDEGRPAGVREMDEVCDGREMTEGAEPRDDEEGELKDGRLDIGLGRAIGRLDEERIDDERTAAGRLAEERIGEGRLTDRLGWALGRLEDTL